MKSPKKTNPHYLLSRVLLRSRLCRFLRFETHGYRLGFHPSDLSAELWFNPNSREADVKLLRAYLKPGDCYIDAGANIGSTVIPAACAVGPKGQVIAFEPHPRILRYLESNVRLNRLDNVTAQGVALDAEEGITFFSDCRSDDRNHVTARADGRFEVKARRLDSLTANIRSIALLKIDVEGLEMRVLRGASKTLQITKAVYIEIVERNFQRYGVSPVDVLALLEDAGFSLLHWCGWHSCSCPARESVST